MKGTRKTNGGDDSRNDTRWNDGDIEIKEPHWSEGNRGDWKC